jgi:adenosylcobinamide kinase / adenosylcobinamide-phosphate guanylyltransferase
MHTLILGGQRSGKSRCAEQRAAAWLRQPGHQATLVATAQAGDAEMHQRITRHRLDRAERVPHLATLELQSELAPALQAISSPTHLLVVDCLTLWLTQLLMPLHGPATHETEVLRQQHALCDVLSALPGPVVLVSNEIGSGLSPVSSEVRAFVDALGRLHQAVAGVCDGLSLMVAGVELPVKRGAV